MKMCQWVRPVVAVARVNTEVEDLNLWLKTLREFIDVAHAVGITVNSYHGIDWDDPDDRDVFGCVKINDSVMELMLGERVYNTFQKVPIGGEVPLIEG